jgi:hypothetical protein
MTPRRLIFEAIHKTAGYVAVLLSVVVILTGLWQSNAPRWMALSLIPWWGLVGFVFFALQKRGMAVDTYMAIWGPDPDLPGNTRARRKPARCPKRGKPEP